MKVRRQPPPEQDRDHGNSQTRAAARRARRDRNHRERRETETMAKLTREEVIEIVGPLDDSRIAEIIETGATAAELLEAVGWLSENGYMGADLKRPLSGTVAKLHTILRIDEPEPEER
jgi:hypothetical protein